jgi:GNAT superfamily N-acetyltransferase
MKFNAKLVPVEEILRWRDHHRNEVNCQIVHDSLHTRPGWTLSYLLFADEVVAGYGATAIGGPWRGKPTIFEFYVVPKYRLSLFGLFEALLKTSAAVAMEVQTNTPLLPELLHAYARDIFSEKIVFCDAVTTTYAPPGATFRRLTEADAAQIETYDLDEDAKWGIAFNGQVVAAGDILYHYNRPFGDIYMKVAEPFRQRGLGAYLVQELKRICYEGGSVPAARCSPQNVASRNTLQRAGFVPCGHILIGTLPA